MPHRCFGDTVARCRHLHSLTQKTVTASFHKVMIHPTRPQTCYFSFFPYTVLGDLYWERRSTCIMLRYALTTSTFNLDEP